MLVYVNGELVPEAEARLSVFDRAFLYGDSLFETLRVCCGRPCPQRWGFGCPSTRPICAGPRAGSSRRTAAPRHCCA